MTNVADPTLNGRPMHDAAPAPTPAACRAARRWIAFPLALIACQMSIVVTMMCIATSDPSFAVEPNYYEKALSWDATAAQNAANERLAWRTGVQVVAARGGGSELVVRLSNSDGAPLDGADVRAEVFANVRAGDRAVLVLTPRGQGVYAAPVAITFAGIWECRLFIERGPEKFTSAAQLEVRAGSAGS